LNGTLTGNQNLPSQLLDATWPLHLRVRVGAWRNFTDDQGLHIKKIQGRWGQNFSGGLFWQIPISWGYILKLGSKSSHPLETRGSGGWTTIAWKK